MSTLWFEVFRFFLQEFERQMQTFPKRPLANFCRGELYSCGKRCGFQPTVVTCTPIPMPNLFTVFLALYTLAALALKVSTHYALTWTV